MYGTSNAAGGCLRGENIGVGKRGRKAQQRRGEHAEHEYHRQKAQNASAPPCAVLQAARHSAAPEAFGCQICIFARLHKDPPF